MTFTDSTEYLEPVEIVETIAAEMGWSHAWQSEEHLVIDHEDHCGTYHQHAGYTYSGLFLSCTRALTIAPSHELEILRLLNLINQHLEYGMFMVDFQNQILLYKVTRDYDTDRPLDREAIEGLLLYIGKFFVQYSPAFLALIGEASETATEAEAGHSVTAQSAFEMCVYQQFGYA